MGRKQADAFGLNKPRKPKFREVQVLYRTLDPFVTTVTLSISRSSLQYLTNSPRNSPLLVKKGSPII